MITRFLDRLTTWLHKPLHSGKGIWYDLVCLTIGLVAVGLAFSTVCKLWTPFAGIGLLLDVIVFVAIVALYMRRVEPVPPPPGTIPLQDLRAIDKLTEVFEREFQKLQAIWGTPAVKAVLYNKYGHHRPLTPEDRAGAMKLMTQVATDPNELPSGWMLMMVLTTRYHGYHITRDQLAGQLYNLTLCNIIVRVWCEKWSLIANRVDIPELSALYLHGEVAQPVAATVAVGGPGWGEEGTIQEQLDRVIGATYVNLLTGLPAYARLDLLQRASRYPTLAELLMPYTSKVYYWQYTEEVNEQLVRLIDNRRMDVELLPTRKDLLLTQWRMDRAEVISGLKTTYGPFASMDVVRFRVLHWLINSLILQLNPHGKTLTESELMYRYLTPMEQEYRRLAADANPAIGHNIKEQWTPMYEVLLVRMVMTAGSTRAVLPSDGIEMVREIFSDAP